MYIFINFYSFILDGELGETVYATSLGLLATFEFEILHAHLNILTVYDKFTIDLDLQ